MSCSSGLDVRIGVSARVERLIRQCSRPATLLREGGEVLLLGPLLAEKARGWEGMGQAFWRVGMRFAVSEILGKVWSITS